MKDRPTPDQLRPQHGRWWCATEARRYRHRSAILPVVVLVVFLTGCGYQLAGNGAAPLPRGVERLAILRFENRTPHAVASIACTDALIAGMVGSRELTANPEDADFVVLGVVTGTRARPAAFAGTGASRQVEMIMDVTVDLTVVDRATGQAILDAPGVVGTASFRGAGSATLVPTERDAAIETACHSAMDDAAQVIAAQLQDVVNDHGKAEEPKKKEEGR